MDLRCLIYETPAFDFSHRLSVGDPCPVSEPALQFLVFFCIVLLNTPNQTKPQKTPQKLNTTTTKNNNPPTNQLKSPKPFKAPKAEFAVLGRLPSTVQHCVFASSAASADAGLAALAENSSRLFAPQCLATPHPLKGGRCVKVQGVTGQQVIVLLAAFAV